MKLQTIIATTGLVCGVSLCQAGPLDWRIVPRDAEWVAHVDMERIVSSKLMASLPDDFDMDDDLGELGDLGIDPRSDVFSVTLYGWGSIDEERVVIVVDGSENLGDALAKLAEHEADSVTRTEKDGRVYYQVDEAEEDHVIGVWERNGGVRLIVAGSIEGIDDAASRRARERAPVIGEGPGDGSLVFISALDIAKLIPDGAGDNGHAQFLKATKGMLLDIAESNDRIQGKLVATIADTQTTQDIADMLQGMVALGRMMLRDKEELRPIAELASGVRITTKESQIQVTVDAPIEVIQKVLECGDELGGGG